MKWTLDSVWRLQRGDYLCREVGSNPTQSALGGERGGDRLRMSQQSCRTLWLMSRCIPAYLDISLRGDPSAQYAFWFLCGSVRVVTQLYHQPTVNSVLCKHLFSLSLPVTSLIKKACLCCVESVQMYTSYTVNLIKRSSNQSDSGKCASDALLWLSRWWLIIFALGIGHLVVNSLACHIMQTAFSI